MKLIDRLSTLLHADAHGVIDSVEDRGLMLRQHVRDAEAALAAKQARMDALTGEAKRLADQSAVLATRIADLDRDVELALARGEEELARFVIKKLLPARRSREAAERRRAAALDEQKALTVTVAEQAQELDALKARAREILTRQESDPLDPSLGGGVVADEEIDLELLRRRSSHGPERTAVAEPERTAAEPPPAAAERAPEAAV